MDLLSLMHHTVIIGVKVYLSLLLVTENLRTLVMVKATYTGGRKSYVHWSQAKLRVPMTDRVLRYLTIAIRAAQSSIID